MEEKNQLGELSPEDYLRGAELEDYLSELRDPARAPRGIFYGCLLGFILIIAIILIIIYL